jgi:hypothetical protein
MKMSRSEKYKSIRRYKKKCRRIIFLSLLLTITGVIAADYSINKLMASNGKIKVVSFENENSKFEINVLNYKLKPGSDFIAKLADQIKSALN